MKFIKYIAIILTLTYVGIITSFADEFYDNSYDELINTFESIETDFKFASIKVNSIIKEDMSKTEIIDIYIDIVNNLGFEESNIQWKEKWDSKESQIYATIKDNLDSISISCYKSENLETYIMIDILSSSDYRNINSTYKNIENIFENYKSNTKIYTCLAGEYKNQLNIDKYDDILAKILYNMNADEIDRVNEDNFLSLVAYSDKLKDNNLEYSGRKINLNIGIRYSENEDKTIIYLATPIIKLDY